MNLHLQAKHSYSQYQSKADNGKHEQFMVLFFPFIRCASRLFRYIFFRLLGKEILFFPYLTVFLQLQQFV